MRKLVAAISFASILVAAPSADAQTRVSLYPARQSDALFDAGIGMAGVGSIAMFVGVVGWSTQHNADGSQCFWSCSDHAAIAFGSIGLLGLGAALVGMPLAIIGGRRVLRVAASVGPTGGALRVTF